MMADSPLDSRLVSMCDEQHLVVLTPEAYLKLSEQGEAIFCPQCRRQMFFVPKPMHDAVLAGKEVAWCDGCSQAQERQSLHRCWRCGRVVCTACSRPDRVGDYECLWCVLWQRTCEVMPEPSDDDC